MNVVVALTVVIPANAGIHGRQLDAVSHARRRHRSGTTTVDRSFIR
jgi:hypothetical protein